MFINFLNGDSRVFTGEEVLEVATKEFVESLDSNRIKKNAVDHAISLLDAKEKVYGIGKTDTYNSFSWAMLIDDTKKTLIVNIDSVLDFNCYYKGYDPTIAKCADSIEEYQIIDAIASINDINVLYSTLEEKFICENKGAILAKCEEFISQNNETFLKTRDNYAKKNYVECFFEDSTPSTPTVLKREELNVYGSSSLEIIYKFVFNREEFEKEITEKILTIIFEDSSKLSQAYNYFLVKEMLLTNIPEEDLVIRKRISDAVKDGGKTLNIITIDGKKVKVNNCFIGKDHFISSVGRVWIYTKDIKTILFGKNVLFER